MHKNQPALRARLRAITRFKVHIGMRINGTKIAVTQEMIDASDERLYVTLDNAMIKPYAINFGKAECTITCDAVKLVRN